MRIEDNTGDGTTDAEILAALSAALKAGSGFVPDDVYRQVLANVVPNCVDVLPFALLERDWWVPMGYRVNEPWKNHWHPSGGRQKPGESYGEAGSRHLERDLGLVIPPNRLHFVSTASFMWSTSAQGVPCHMNGILMSVELEKEELEARKGTKGDFATNQLFTLNKVTEAGGFHPAIAMGAATLVKKIEDGMARKF